MKSCIWQNQRNPYDVSRQAPRRKIILSSFSILGYVAESTTLMSYTDLLLLDQTGHLRLLGSVKL